MAVASLQRWSAMKSCLSNTSLSFCCFSPGSTSKCHHAAWQCVLLGHTMTWTPSAASPLLALSLSLSVSRHLNICLIIGGVFKHPWNALFLEFKLLKILFLFFFFFYHNVFHVRSVGLSWSCWQHPTKLNKCAFSLVAWIHPKWQSGATLAATITSPPLFCTTVQSAFLWIIQRDREGEGRGHGGAG